MNGKTESDDAQKGIERESEKGVKREREGEIESDRNNRDLVNDSGKRPENYGRYFGVCFSYHNSKACICGRCSSYPGKGNIFCSRGKSELTDDMHLEMKKGCLCRDCELYRKFRFEGQYFCRGK